MRPGRSALGVIAGLLLGLGVVALTSSGINSYGTHATQPRAILFVTNGTRIQSTNATNTIGSSAAFSGSNTTFTVIEGQTSSTGEGPTHLAGITAKAAPVSQMNSIARQPITLTGVVLLPILAALLFGFVFYRVSRVRNEGEGRTEATEPF
jgi:hypothetical protein